MYYELEPCIELESKYGYIFKQKKEKGNIKETKMPCNLSIITWNWICKCILIRPWKNQTVVFPLFPAWKWESSFKKELLD